MEFDIGEFDNHESSVDFGGKKLFQSNLIRTFDFKDGIGGNNLSSFNNEIYDKKKSMKIHHRIHSLPQILNFSKVEIEKYHYGKGILKPEEIRNYCNVKRPKSQLYSRKMNVYDKVKIIHCSVPRIASYSFNKLWYKAHQHNETPVETLLIPRPIHLFKFPPEERDRKFYTHKKVLFGREPFSRLWSAYNSKLVNPNPWFFKSYGGLIGSKRPKHSNGTFCGNDISFEEFLRFVIEHITSSTRPNGIWWPISLICDPCNVQYDVIGKIEEQEDLDQILHNVGLSGPNIFMPKVNASVEKSSYLEETIRKRLLSEDCESLELFIQNRWRYFVNQGLVDKNIITPKLNKLNWHTIDNHLLARVFKNLPKKEDEAVSLVKLRRMERLDEELERVGKPLKDTINALFKLDYDLFGYPIRN